ncbi:unnamed protein product [Calypogeia fissa]
MAGGLARQRGVQLVRNLIRGEAILCISAYGSSPSTQVPFSSYKNVGPIHPAPGGQHRGMSSLQYHVESKYGGQRSILPVGVTHVPDVAVDAWVAPNAVLAGDVIVQDKASIWYGVVLRGDLNRIKIGPWSSVGDKCVFHAAESCPGITAETDIGRFVTIGAYSTLRSCVVGDYTVIGQRCVIMEGSIVEKNAILASGSVVPPGRRIPGGEVWEGNPARFVRMVTNDEIALIPKLAEKILEFAQTHSEEFLPYSTAYLEVEKLFASSKVAL